MPIILYLDYLSQPARAVLSLCLIGKIPHEVVEVRLNRGETRSQQFKKINPMMKVPAMGDTDAGINLAESHTIMRYLALKFPQNLQQWYPTGDLAKRAKIDEYFDFHHLNTRRCANLVFNTLFAKKLGVQDPTFNPEKARKQLELALKLFTKFYLKDQDFIMGDKPTMADLSAFFQIQMLYLMSYDFSKWEKIEKWMGRMSQIEEVRTANGAFLKLAARLNPSAKL